MDGAVLLCACGTGIRRRLVCQPSSGSVERPVVARGPWPCAYCQRVTRQQSVVLTVHCVHGRGTEPQVAQLQPAAAGLFVGGRGHGGPHRAGDHQRSHQRPRGGRAPLRLRGCEVDIGPLHVDIDY